MAELVEVNASTTILGSSDLHKPSQVILARFAHELDNTFDSLGHLSTHVALRRLAAIPAVVLVPPARISIVSRYVHRAFVVIVVIRVATAA